jgi:hypothetical protein
MSFYGWHAGTVPDRIRAIATEIAQHWLLVGQGCSDVGYLDKLRATGFHIKYSFNHLTNTAVTLTGKPLRAGMYDFVAVSRPSAHLI